MQILSMENSTGLDECTNTLQKTMFKNYDNRIRTKANNGVVLPPTHPPRDLPHKHNRIPPWGVRATLDQLSVILAKSMIRALSELDGSAGSAFLIEKWIFDRHSETTCHSYQAAMRMRQAKFAAGVPSDEVILTTLQKFLRSLIFFRGAIFKVSRGLGLEVEKGEGLNALLTRLNHKRPERY